MDKIEEKMDKIEEILNYMFVFMVLGFVGFVFTVWGFDRKLMAVDRKLNKLTMAVDEIRAVTGWLLISTPERVDFWHPRVRQMQAPTSRPKIKDEVAEFYGVDSNSPPCAVTGTCGNHVAIAHLLPRNSASQVYFQFGLDPNNHRDCPRMCLFLCKDLEQAYDRKRFSFYLDREEEGLYIFKMNIWDPALRNKCIRRMKMNETEDNVPKIEHFENQEFRFRKDKAPFTRVLSYHNRICYYHSLTQEWLEEGKKMEPEVFGTPLGKEITVYEDLKNFHDESTSGTPRTGFIKRTDSDSTKSLTVSSYEQQDEE